MINVITINATSLNTAGAVKNLIQSNDIAIPLEMTADNKSSYIDTYLCLRDTVPYRSYADTDDDVQLYLVVEGDNDASNYYLSAKVKTEDGNYEYPYEQIDLEPDEIEALSKALNEIEKDGINMKSTNEINRPAIAPEIFDLTDIDYNSFSNTVLLNFRRRSDFEDGIQLIYNCIMRDTDRPMQPSDTFFMFVRAVNDIHYYDGCYTYSFACAWTDEDGNTRLTEFDVADLTEQEKQYVQNIIWGNANTIDYLHLHIQDYLTITYPNEEYKVFCGNAENDTYKGLWVSVGSNKAVMVVVDGYYNGIADISCTSAIING